MSRKLKYVISISLLLGLFAAGIILSGPGLAFVSAKSNPPEQVVDDFYRWYLDYIGPDAEGDFHNPLVEQAYQSSPFLSREFTNRLIEVLESEQSIHYDPFLCAQDIPETIMVIGAFQKDDQATAVIQSSFYQHIYTVDLEKSWGQWKISNVDCGTSSSSVAAAFYGWYLDYFDIRDGGDFTNPLVDQAYRSSRLLSDQLITTVDEALAGMKNGGFDPFLLAQDIPTSYRVEVGPGENLALVYLLFGSDYEKILQIEVSEENGRLVIDRIMEFKL